MRYNYKTFARLCGFCRIDSWLIQWSQIQCLSLSLDLRPFSSRHLNGLVLWILGSILPILFAFPLFLDLPICTGLNILKQNKTKQKHKLIDTENSLVVTRGEGWEVHGMGEGSKRKKESLVLSYEKKKEKKNTYSTVESAVFFLLHVYGNLLVGVFASTGSYRHPQWTHTSKWKHTHTHAHAHTQCTHAHAHTGKEVTSTPKHSLHRQSWRLNLHSCSQLTYSKWKHVYLHWNLNSRWNAMFLKNINIHSSKKL